MSSLPTSTSRGEADVTEGNPTAYERTPIGTSQVDLEQPGTSLFTCRQSPEPYSSRQFWTSECPRGYARVIESRGEVHPCSGFSATPSVRVPASHAGSCSWPAASGHWASAPSTAQWWLRLRPWCLPRKRSR